MEVKLVLCEWMWSSAVHAWVWVVGDTSHPDTMRTCNSGVLSTFSLRRNSGKRYTANFIAQHDGVIEAVPRWQPLAVTEA